ncbi:MAG: zinc-binding alcohol dehydrogenase family protein [Bradymonadia bacterium]
MKALVLHGQDETPVVEEIDTPQPGPGEVQIRIEAAALNHRDVYITEGKYPAIMHPAVLGSDGCGTVTAVGEGVDSGWIDARVLGNPSLNWGPDPRFQGMEYSILGMPTQGTLAEYITLPVENVARCPSHLESAQAAAIPLAGLTAWRALVTRAQVARGDTVLVTGIGGGVALFALQFALALGAEVWVTSSSAQKIERAVALGARGGALYTDEGWGGQLTEMVPSGFDVIIDSAGGEGFGTLVRLLGFGGRLAFYGGTRGKWPKILPQYLFFKQVSILASTMGSPADFEAMVTCIAEHQIEPVVDQCFTLDEGAKAFERLSSGGQFGKVVVQV